MSDCITNEEIGNRKRRKRWQMRPEEALCEYEKQWRKELKTAMEDSLAYTLGVPRESIKGKIPFTVTSDIGTRKLLWRWKVEAVGWPRWINFDSPGELSGAEVCELIRLFARGKVYFRRLREDELERKARAHGLSVRTLSSGHHAWREDAQHGAQVRRPETQSKKCARRRPKVTKTSATVPEDA